jgi:hypothetical protein
VLPNTGLKQAISVAEHVRKSVMSLRNRRRRRYDGGSASVLAISARMARKGAPFAFWATFRKMARCASAI